MGLLAFGGSNVRAALVADHFGPSCCVGDFRHLVYDWPVSQPADWSAEMITKPSKQKVRNRLADQVKRKETPPSNEEIRRTLGWYLLPKVSK